MAFDLSSLSDDAFDAEYHRRLATKTPAEAGQKIAQTALISMGGNETPQYLARPTTPDVSQVAPQTPTRQFVGQRGDVVTRPYEDISNSYIDKRGIVRPTVIDARAPLAKTQSGLGGPLAPLTAPSLRSEAEFRAEFQPSQDLQRLIDRSQNTSNAASRVQNYGTSPTAAFGSGQSSPDTTNKYIAANSTVDASGNRVINFPSGGSATIGPPIGGPKIASSNDGDIQNDPFRKFFGGGIQQPTPTPTPAPPPKVAQDTPYWRKKEDENSYYG